MIGKGQNYMSLVCLSAKDNQKLSKLFSKGSKVFKFIGMNIKEKVRMKIRQISIDLSSNQHFQELAVYLFWFIQTKLIILKDLMPKSIIYKKAILITITLLWELL